MKSKIITVLFFFLISSILVANFLFKSSLMTTDDYPFHLTMIAQFAKAIQSGDFPVRWANGFANYGGAIPIVAHQFTSYSGAFIYFFTHNILFSGNILFLIGAILSNIFLYIFLRYYFPRLPSLTAVFLFNFSSYRIFNIYVRGALPEFFSTLFATLVLIGIYYICEKKQLFKGFVLTTIAAFFLSLNHPMMILIYAPLFLSYELFLFFNRCSLKHIFLSFLATLLGVACASYYLIPLLVEIKYFYYGSGINHFNFNQFPTLINYLETQGMYIYKSNLSYDIKTLKQLNFGIFESSIFIISFILLFFKKNLLVFCLFIAGVFYFFMTLRMSAFIYQHVTVFQMIQFPWRMWAGLLIVVPILFAYILDSYSKKLLCVLCIVIILILRLPYAHGNNFQLVNQSIYFFNPDNVNGIMMQTIWSGDPKDYPVKTRQSEIIKGVGVIQKSNIKNSRRLYTISASEDLRLIDYTFYFPGWHVFVDNKEVPIQFQDPAYRGIITYNVPKGSHEVKLVFQETKLRYFADIITIFFFALTSGIIIFIYNYGSTKSSRRPSRVQRIPNTRKNL